MENDAHESIALKVINESLKLPFVKVNRSEFLVKMFGNKIDDIDEMLEKGPEHFLSKKELDQAANSRINSITAQSSAVSFATGLPGGLAMAATIPADVAQFYAYSLKLAQEISYIYGYADIWNQQGELTEEAKNTLILYLGIMLGVNSAGSVVRVSSSKLSQQALKKIPQKALTKTFYYPILKKVLGVFGIKLTKASFAKGVSKVIPVVGGVVSGGINFLSMKPMATRLKNELSKGIDYTPEDFEKDVKILNDDQVIINEVNRGQKNEVEIQSDQSEQENVIEQIERAHELLEKGMIDEAEFKVLKGKILSK